MCYMTRQLFPSPSQGALICAGGGEEGRLAAAAPASDGAGRRDPAPHSGGWTRGFALPSAASEPFGGSCSRRQRCACGGPRSPPLGPGDGPGGWAGSPLLRTGAGGAPSNLGARAPGSRPRARRRARAPERRSPRLGSRAGASVAELVCSLFLSRGTRNPFCNLRALAVLKLPGRGRRRLCVSGGLNPRGLWPYSVLTALLAWATQLVRATSGRARRAPAGTET